jgi:hypothetical protein
MRSLLPYLAGNILFHAKIKGSKNQENYYSFAFRNTATFFNGNYKSIIYLKK